MANTSKIISLFAVVQFVTMSCFLYTAKTIFISRSSATAGPFRWLTATILPLLIVVRGMNKKSLSWSGGMLALLMGFILTLAHTSFMLSLIVFFLTSSAATRFRQNLKRQIEGAEFKEGGQRNWVQVLCNGGVATEIALIYLIDIGSSDLPIDFSRFYHASWLGTALLGSLACCGGDTWASELGTVLSKSDPFLITTFRKVPKGTNGGISVIGLACSFAGGLVVGLAFYAGIVLMSVNVQHSPCQFHLIWLGGLAGLIGSIIDSILGATVQFSGYDKDSKAIVEVPGPNVVHISGLRLLDNHSVNLISSILTAVVVPQVALNFYQFR